MRRIWARAFRASCKTRRVRRRMGLCLFFDTLPRPISGAGCGAVFAGSGQRLLSAGSVVAVVGCVGLVGLAVLVCGGVSGPGVWMRVSPCLAWVSR